MGGEGCLVERGGGLLEGGSLFEWGRGGLNRGFTVIVISPEKKRF